MRLSLAVLGLLGAGIGAGSTTSTDAPDPDGYALAEAPGDAQAEPRAYGPDGAPLAAPSSAPEETPSAVDPLPGPRERQGEREPAQTRREPPTPPAHVNELFRTPGGSLASPQSPDPSNPPVLVAPQQTTQPAPPPRPPPRPAPRPWGGNDPCPPCGMG